MGWPLVFVLKKSILWRWHNFEGAELRMMALNSWALAKVTKAWKGRSDGDGSVFGGGKGQLWSKVMEQHLSCPLQYHPCITIHHVPTNATSVSESTHKYHLYITKFLKIPPLHHHSPCTHKYHLCIRKYSEIPPLYQFLQVFKNAPSVLKIHQKYQYQWNICIYKYTFSIHHKLQCDFHCPL